VAKTVSEATVINNGESKILEGIKVEAIPMYNLVRGPSAGKLYHDKGRGNGYILTIGGKRVYISGDTECTPEMKALKNIDVAFVCMNLPYTMPPEEAAECVRAFRPKIVYPYHYRNSDLNVLAKALKSERGIEVRMRNWYE
jgi:L-ascorbate metabolism protein UlaG (beta-lactamase superfamily)